MNLAGAVLTGGRSSRMGTDKALLPVDGVPMAEVVACVLEAAGCDPVVLVGGDAETLRRLGRPVVADLIGGRRGPVAGVHAALVESAPSTEAVLVGACDLVDLDGSVVAALVQRWEGAESPPDVVVAHTGRREPLCALWSPRCASVLEAALEDDRGPSVLAVLDRLETVVEVPVAPDRLRNVNTPSDLRRTQGAG